MLSKLSRQIVKLQRRLSQRGFRFCVACRGARREAEEAQNEDLGTLCRSCRYIGLVTY